MYSFGDISFSKASLANRPLILRLVRYLNKELCSALRAPLVINSLHFINELADHQSSITAVLIARTIDPKCHQAYSIHLKPWPSSELPARCPF